MRATRGYSGVRVLIRPSSGAGSLSDEGRAHVLPELQFLLKREKV